MKKNTQKNMQSSIEQVRELLGDEAYSRIVAEGLKNGMSEYETVAYRDKQLVYLQDLNGMSYSSGEIRFDTFSARAQFKCWSDAVLALDLSLISSGTPYTGTASDLIAFNSSALGAVFGIRISMASGQTIQNSLGGIFFDNLQKILYEKDSTWLGCEAPQIHFSKSSGNDSLTLSFPLTAFASATFVATAGTTTAIITGISAFPSSGFPVTSVTGGIDMGFLQRAALFKKAFTYGNSVYKGKVFIPLHYLSDLFAKLNFAIVNDQFLLSFFTSFGVQGGAPAAAATSLPAVGVQQAQCWQVGTYTALPTVCFNSSARIYYHKLTLSPPVLAEYNRQLTSGMMRKIWFRDVESVQPQSFGGFDFNQTVIQNCVRPHRLSILRYQASAIYTGTASYLLQAPSTNWSNVQISINNSVQPWTKVPLDRGMKEVSTVSVYNT